MYQNVISEYYDNHDVEDADLEILKKKEKEFLLRERPYEIAHLIALWLKYFGKESVSFENLVNAYSYELFTDLKQKEMNVIYKAVEKILKEKYQIHILTRDPLILRSNTLLEDV